MSHISKKKVSEKVLQKVHDSLLAVLTAEKAVARKRILRELLTDTELTMLAKRFAAINMLAEGKSYYAVAKLLGMSTSTLRRFQLELDQNKYVVIPETVNSKKEREKFWKEIETFINMGMPRRVGKERWSFLDNLK